MSLLNDKRGGLGFPVRQHIFLAMLLNFIHVVYKSVILLSVMYRCKGFQNKIWLQSSMRSFKLIMSNIFYCMCTVKLKKPYSNFNFNVRRLDSEKVRPTMGPQTENTSFVVNNLEVVGKVKDAYLHHQFVKRMFRDMAKAIYISSTGS